MPAATRFDIDLSRYGGALIVDQAFGGQLSHTGVFTTSLDFRLPMGSEVYALAAGTVIALREDVHDGGFASTSASNAVDPSNGPSNIGNFATLQDSSGRVMTYQHFGYMDIAPTKGASLSTGAALGEVGETGYRTAPHLHVTFSTGTIALTNFGAGSPTSLVADGGRGGVVFDTATGVIELGVVSQRSYDLRSASGLNSGQHNLTLIGKANIDGQGDSLDNVLSGNRGANLLYGRNGDDTISGGEGRDTLLGGLGHDVLNGGPGADRFNYDGISDSPAGAGHDVIIAFSHAEGDRIDLSAIDFNTTRAGAQDPIWIGSASFHHVAGELRFSAGLLQGDVNGDGRADFEISLPGISSLSTSDILF